MPPSTQDVPEHDQVNSSSSTDSETSSDSQTQNSVGAQDCDSALEELEKDYTLPKWWIPALLRSQLKWPKVFDKKLQDFQVPETISGKLTYPISGTEFPMKFYSPVTRESAKHGASDEILFLDLRKAKKSRNFM